MNNDSREHLRAENEARRSRYQVTNSGRKWRQSIFFSKYDQNKNTVSIKL